MNAAELLTQGVPLHPYEAVAVVLAFVEDVRMHHLDDRDGAPDAPAPSLAMVTIDTDGVVSCGDAGPVSPAGIATLLQRLLERTPHIPPGLLYAIARGRGEVAAPAFESVDALLKTLRRFEQGPRRDVVVKLCVRVDGTARSEEPGPSRDRRSATKTITPLRRELRVMDRGDYERQAACTGATEAGQLTLSNGGAPIRDAVPTARVAVWKRLAMGAAAGVAVALVCAPAFHIARTTLGLAGTGPRTIEASRSYAGISLGAPVVTPVLVVDAIVADAAITPSAHTSMGTRSAARQPKKVATRDLHKPSKWRTVFGFGWVRHLIGTGNDAEEAHPR